MVERIAYDENGLPVIVDDGAGAEGVPKVGTVGSGQPSRDEPRMRRSGFNAVKMFARRPLVGVKKIKPEEEELVLDETIPPIRKFGYAPQAMLLTNEGSLYVAKMRVTMEIGNKAIVGTIPADVVVLPGFPTPLPDLVFMLNQPFLSGVTNRVKLFATWQLPPIRNFVELTIYSKNPMPYIQLGVPIPRDIIIYENFSLPLPTAFTKDQQTFESVLDEDIDLPYELQFDKQMGGPVTNAPNNNTGTIIPQLFLRISQWASAQDTVTYDWRIQFEDGGR